MGDWQNTGGNPRGLNNCGDVSVRLLGQFDCRVNNWLINGDFKKQGGSSSPPASGEGMLEELPPN